MPMWGTITSARSRDDVPNWLGILSLFDVTQSCGIWTVRRLDLSSDVLSCPGHAASGSVRVQHLTDNEEQPEPHG